MSLDQNFFSKTRDFLNEFRFHDLFIQELGWSQPATTKPKTLAIQSEGESQTYTYLMIAEVSGVVVLEITAGDGQIPDGKVRNAIHQEIEQLYRENLLIFVDRPRSRSLWYWVKREGTKRYIRDHLYIKGQPGDLFLSKLGALVIELSDWEHGEPSVVEIAGKLQSGFDVERITKKFYQEFKDQHETFLQFIQGIDKAADRRWYTSVMLNRLMFVYFLQRKGFLDRGDLDYLQNQLKASQQRGKDLFYRQFLLPLFFEAFAKPEKHRDEKVKELVGEVKYLNGGLFLQHRIENEYQNITIGDEAFAQILDLFSRYSWNLNDTPEGNDDEINPDVLGYIFEKYINQKEFGAYYTRPEITEYLCEKTIHQWILDRVNGKVNGISGITYPTINDLLLKLDSPLCQLLLQEILPSLSILDPACGSGAFLVAGMKTLIGIYSAVIGTIHLKGSRELKQWLKETERQHPSLGYFIKKRIITDNLYGVDIMEEATEIAKLRLFLALVSVARSVEELEPLPNIDFNIMAGNSLIGLIRVDAESFDNVGNSEYQQGNLLQSLAASNYQAILAEKNRSIELYKQHAFQAGEVAGTAQEDRLQMLRNHIEGVNRESMAKLNQLLLDEFSQKLGIKYEAAQLKGKGKKRVLTKADMEQLKPFHWGYHFDKIIQEKGGFDVIIANPPWEVFKPNAKEFFAEYSELISKKKMDIKAFEKAQKTLLQDEEIAAAWLEYQSQFPHVSQYYRSTEQYKNQISVVNGKKQGTDINLYKLFVEQCFNLLHPHGQCGMVIPSGIYTDLGSKQLREMLFSQTKMTGLFCFENRQEIFEGVHRSFKFVVLTFEKDGQTQAFPAKFMRHDVQELRQFPDDETLSITVDLIRKLSPDSISVMEFKSDLDIHIAEKMTKFPLLGEQIPGKWNLKLTSEFHMTNDSHLFKTEPKPGRLPLYEGKMIHQFTHQFAKPKYWLDEQEARQALLKRGQTDEGQILDYQKYRLGFRDVARNTDIRTAISTITPCVFHGNKLPNTKIYDDDGKILIKNDEQIFLCAILNSFVLDWMIRQRVSSTLNFFYIYQIPVPRLTEGDPYFTEIVERAAKLICTTPEFDDLALEVGLGSHKNGVTDEMERAKLRAELDGIIAHLYELTEAEFQHILNTFPIVPDAVKAAALDAYKQQ
jgi:hypothetical protein